MNLPDWLDNVVIGVLIVVVAFWAARVIGPSVDRLRKDLDRDARKRQAEIRDWADRDDLYAQVLKEHREKQDELSVLEDQEEYWRIERIIRMREHDRLEQRLQFLGLTEENEPELRYSAHLIKEADEEIERLEKNAN